MAVEDFTTFTEVDVDSDITVTSTKVEWVTMDMDITSYVYKDYGVDNFGNFEHDIEVEYSTTDADATVAHWALANEVTTMYDLWFNQKNAIYFYKVANSFYIGNASTRASDGSSVSTNTLYYVTITRAGTTLTAKIYTDSGRTNLHDTISVTCVTTAFRYLYACMARDEGSTPYLSSGYSQNFNLDAAAGTLYETPSDSVSITDSVAFKHEIPIDDTLDMTDDLTLTHVVVLDDTLSIDDNVVFTNLLHLNDTLDIDDTPVFKHGLNIDDLINITDNIIQTRKIIFDDDFDVTDSPIFKHKISLSDDMEMYTLFSHGSNNFQSFEDYFSISDTALMKHGFNFSDSVDINDSILFTHKLLPIDYISITDSIALYLYNADMSDISFPDSLNIMDAVTFKRLLILNDDLNITDEAVFKHKFYSTDTLNISDSIIFGHSLDIIDSVNIEDNVLFILFAGKLFIHLSENLDIVDTILFKHKLLPTDIITISDSILFQFLISFADSMNFEDFIFNSLVFKLNSDSYNIQLPMPIYAGETGSLSNDLVLFNFWSNDRDVNTIGISDEPITLTGTIYAHINDKETGMSSIATKFLNIHALMNNHEEVIITGLGNSVDATYIIKNFRYGTVRGSPYAYTWQLTLEYVRI